jgi:hypothetical protein
MDSSSVPIVSFSRKGGQRSKRTPLDWGVESSFASC